MVRGGFEEVFVGALGAETGRKRSALWTLSCTWFSGLALSRTSSGPCPDRRWQKTEVLLCRSLTPLLVVYTLVSVLRVRGSECLVLIRLGSSASLGTAKVSVLSATLDEFFLAFHLKS